jgi:hypothetical protein
VPGESVKESGQRDAHRDVEPPKPRGRQIDKELLNDKAVKIDAIGIIRALDDREPFKIRQPNVDRDVAHGHNRKIIKVAANPKHEERRDHRANTYFKRPDDPVFVEIKCQTRKKTNDEQRASEMTIRGRQTPIIFAHAQDKMHDG